MNLIATPAGGCRKVSAGMFAAFILWVAIVSGGTIGMIVYANTPGHSGQAPGSWPAGSRLSLDAKQPTLVMFVHPHCSCSRASLGELDELLARCHGKIKIYVVFIKPEGAVANWEKTDLWRTASSMPGVHAYVDNDGIEARRFHAETSGQTMLYDPHGALQFQGGITLGRGHAGDNPGRSALEEFVQEGHSSQRSTPVYGCSLFDDQCKQGDVTCKQ